MSRLLECVPFLVILTTGVDVESKMNLESLFALRRLVIVNVVFIALQICFYNFCGWIQKISFYDVHERM